MTHPQVEQAARNNAIWCDTICRTHRVPGEFHDFLWLNRHQVPRFYPNAVTLSKTHGVTEQLRHIQALMAEKIPGGFAVKDSFCRLDLAPLDFRLLFEAVWLWRPASLSTPERAIAGMRWVIVKEAPELTRWEAAWNGLPAAEPSALPARIFLPTLLDNKAIVFIAAYQDEQIVAGAIANRTEEVVGLSNVFVLKNDAPRFWAGCVTAALEVFPGLPLVTYGSGSELEIALTLGFEEWESLRVWVRQE